MQSRAATPVGLVRGVLAREVVISTELDPFLSVKALATYSGLSERRLRYLLNDPIAPLPAYKIGNKLLVRRSEYDAWASQHRHRPHADVDAVVDDVLASLSKA